MLLLYLVSRLCVYVCVCVCVCVYVCVTDRQRETVIYR